MNARLIRLSAALMLLASLRLATAQNTEVTYQGRMLDGGTGFTGTGQFQFALVTGTNIAATATAAANPPSGGFITIINVTFGGYGYTNAPGVTISGGGGSGAEATATVGGGLVTAITVNHAGSNYTSTPTVTVAPPPPDIAYTTYWSNDETSTNGSEPATSVTVGVSNGLFTVALGDTTISNMAALNALLFEQPLELRIWFNDGVNGFAALEPPQVLTAAPYAAMANTVNEITAAQLGDNPVFSGMAFAAAFSGPSGLFIGGENNTIGSGSAGCAIGGGAYNQLGTGSSYHTIGGGYDNSVAAGGDYCTIGGGAYNQMGTNNYSATIGGGVNNFLGPNNWGSFIGGGENNEILGPTNSSGYYSYAVIGGGQQNMMGSYVEGIIAGGLYNNIGNGEDEYDYAPFIGGGYQNSIGNNAAGAVIAGGLYNHIGDATAGYESGDVIAGGYQNTIGTNAETSFIGAGANNQIGNGRPGFYYSSVIAGGYQNTIGTNVFYSAIGGGYENTIQSNAQYAVIPGGANNIAGGIVSFAAGWLAYATNNGSFVWSDGSTATSSSVQNSVTFRASGGYRFFTGGGASGAQLAAGATAWSTLCDREAKKNFQPVDTLAVLNTLSGVPIQEWNYRWEKDTDVPNIGPVAQDFKAAFYPGRDDKTITTLEFDGIELAAIQGLNRKLENRVKELEGRSQSLEAENAVLTTRLEKLERRLAGESGGKP